MVILEESPWYNEILRRGEERGEARGEARGKADIVLRQLPRRIGSLDLELQDQIRGLSLDQLNDLSDALLDFTELSDLITWLADCG